MSRHASQGVTVRNFWLWTFREKIVVESEDAPLTNTQTLSLMKENEQTSAEGSGDGGDLDGYKGKNRYASLKSFKEKIVVESEDVPLMNTRSLSTLSLPIFDERNEQSSAEGSGDGGDLEGHKGKSISLKSFKEKIVVESEDVPLKKKQTLSTLSLPIFDEGNEQSSAEGSVDGGDLEGHKGKIGCASLKSFQEKIVVESEDVPLTNTETLSTLDLSLPIFDEGKEQSLAAGSGMLFKSQQELSPSKKPKSKIGKAKRTTSRVERGGTNRSECEVM